MKIELVSTIIPTTGEIRPGILCLEFIAEMVDRRLEELAKLGEDEWPIIRSCYPSTTTTTAIASPRSFFNPYASPIVTQIPPSPFEKRYPKSQRRPICNHIANRLLVRLQATIHRRSHTTIAWSLSPGAADRATYNRKRKWTNLTRTPQLRIYDYTACCGRPASASSTAVECIAFEKQIVLSIALV